MEVRGIQKADDGGGIGHPSVEQAKDNDHVAVALAEGANLVAGTAWLFAREELEGGLDTLVVDEAGQLSLANVLAVAGAADRLVLVGDPRQLAQSSKGTHPEGAEVSGLDHVLGDHATVPEGLGLFLDRHRRRPRRGRHRGLRGAPWPRLDRRRGPAAPDTPGQRAVSLCGVGLGSRVINDPDDCDAILRGANVTAQISKDEHQRLDPRMGVTHLDLYSQMLEAPIEDLIELGLRRYEAVGVTVARMVRRETPPML